MFQLILEGLALIAAFLFAKHYIHRRMTKLPPGPIGLPIIGNILDMPKEKECEVIAGWSRKYGDMVYVENAGTPMLFLNGYKPTADLLDKRSGIYSDRGQPVMGTELCGMGELVPVTAYGDRFKLERKLMNQALSTRAVEKWEPLVVAETHWMLKRVLTDPEQFVPHLRRMAGSLIYMAIYGYRVTSDDDPYVKAAEEFMTISSYAITGSWLVNFLPFLRHIPGLRFKKHAQEWRQKMDEWVEKPHAMFKESITSSIAARESFCGNLLFPEDGHKVDAYTEDRIKWTATSMYGAGSDTTVASVSQLILAMTIHPDVQKKAQKEIDAVVGRHRLPTLADRPNLPYVDNVLKEVMRWGTPVPLGIPHRLIRADEYDGKFIPEGTLCVTNMWAMLHDERVFPDPHRFYPERFEGKVDPEQAKLLDPATYIFGFGRRRCPGLHFASPSVWLASVSLLACFDISPIKNAKGEPVPPSPSFIPGTFRHPTPFKCNIVPRYDQVSTLIDEAVGRLS